MQIYEILTQDHDELKQLLGQLVALDAKSDPRELVGKIRDGLVPHSRAEEAVFYNTLRTFEDARKTIRHSFKEHMEAEALLHTLQMKEKLSADWKKTARELKDGIENHIAEEQGEVFALARRHLSDEEAEQIGAAFRKLKAQKLDEGFLMASLDLVANLMPPRFTERLRKFGETEQKAG